MKTNWEFRRRVGSQTPVLVADIRVTPRVTSKLDAVPEVKTGDALAFEAQNRLKRSSVVGHLEW
jgi:hypothetical protein